MTREPIMLGGVMHVHVSEFAKRVGVTIPTVYQWKSQGDLPFSARYLGKLWMEEKAIEPFKKSKMEKAPVYR